MSKYIQKARKNLALWAETIDDDTFTEQYEALYHSRGGALLENEISNRYHQSVTTPLETLKEQERVIINVDDVFMNKDTHIMLRVLSYTGEGENRSYRCILEYNGDCWHGDYTTFHINKYYTKLENFSNTIGEQK